jgi:hypothetical protein
MKTFWYSSSVSTARSAARSLAKSTLTKNTIFIGKTIGRFLTTQKIQKFTVGNFFFQNAIFLFVILPSYRYRRSLQLPQKEHPTLQT